jgi:glycolate oxidase iron-sulfur subunit
MFREDPLWARRAERVSALTRDITEFLSEIGLAPATNATGFAIAYHSACSMQHGQKITAQPKALLTAAGYTVRDVPEGHLCCGSAGTYNLLQPELAAALRDRKLSNIAATRPDAVATGNIGCIAQLAPAAPVPVLHTVELLDWATGGPRPVKLNTLV